MKLSYESLKDKAGWKAAGVILPGFDCAAMAAATKDAPIWVHFGAGNIFRGFIAALQNRLLNAGDAYRGIIAVDTFDYDLIDKIYHPYDNLTLNVTLNSDATLDKEIIASVAEALKADMGNEQDMARLMQVFTAKSLQMVSFTITEKGYALYRTDGSLMPVVQADMAEGPDKARHAMSVVAALLYKRYLAGRHPVAMVSMDNCSHNGEKLKESILAIAAAWHRNGFIEDGFMDYLGDESTVAFPWSMIDKITPRPAKSVEDALTAAGIEGMAPIVTTKNTFIAPFVNAEKAQYLVIEDKFPNGRPVLENAGIYLSDRDTVNKMERMKVTTCLNPLHTAMSIYGCLLGYKRICDEMHDADIVALIRRLGYTEGLPVVTDPGILDPKQFIDEVVEQRLPNPFMPDTPQRIATDTSQKISIRFGETIKSYISRSMPLSSLVSVPLAIAGWLRYLLAVDDGLMPMEVSSDPLKDELQRSLSGIIAGKPETYKGQLRPILANAAIFGSDLMANGLGERIESLFIEQLAGNGAVRATLHKYVS